MLVLSGGFALSFPFGRYVAAISSCVSDGEGVKNRTFYFSFSSAGVSIANRKSKFSFCGHVAARGNLVCSHGHPHDHDLSLVACRGQKEKELTPGCSG
jgi:hypothetical protein